MWTAAFWYRHRADQTAHITIPLDPEIDMVVQKFHPKWLFAENGRKFDRAFIEGEVEFTECPDNITPGSLKPVQWPGLL